MPRRRPTFLSQWRYRIRQWWHQRQRRPLRRGGGQRRLALSALRLPRLNWRWLGRAAVILGIWGGVALACIIGWYSYDLPDVHDIEGRTRKPSITVLAADGSRVARFGDYFAAQTNVDDMPKDLINAVVAVEDRRFFSHFGIDPWGLLRAVFVNLRAGHLVQGGSTITQQLAKNLFLSPARTLRRKIQEMLLALWLEREYSKDQILTAYLNRVYLGAGAYGVGAAAETYFNKPLERLNLYEAAVLAGLLKAPSRYAPTNDPEAAHDRAAIVLSTMIDAGYITPTLRDKALSGSAKSTPPSQKFDGRYFAAWIVEQAQAYAQTMGQDLIIATTLDPKLQRAAERHLEKLVNEGSRKKQNVTQAALVSLASDGAIRAYVGGYDYESSEFDRVTSARRQPGSAFKPFVYLAAIMHGLTPDTPVYDGPIDIGDYAPDNYQGKYYGATTAREALARSMNAVAVKLAQQHGIEAVRRVARKLGINSPLGQDMSLALGTSEVSLYEMTAAYATIANAGKLVAPYAINEIRNRDGVSIYHRSDIAMPQVVDAEAAATLTDMMQSVLHAEGTAARAAFGRPAAGKTGTTQNYHDAWFIGFTADYVTGVWFGNDDNRPMKKITGGALPARLWHDYMQVAHKDLPERALPALRYAPVWSARQANNTNSAPTATHSPTLNIVDEVGGLIGRLLGGQ
jgi:penicillin-binding protein 1A